MPLGDLDCPPAGDVVVVVGPEGGLAPEELDGLAAAGNRVKDRKDGSDWELE